MSLHEVEPWLVGESNTTSMARPFDRNRAELSCGGTQRRHAQTGAQVVVRGKPRTIVSHDAGGADAKDCHHQPVVSPTRIVANEGVPPRLTTVRTR